MLQQRQSEPRSNDGKVWISNRFQKQLFIVPGGLFIQTTSMKFSIPDQYQPGTVNTVHILNSGEILCSLEEYMLFESRFEWVDRSHIVAKMLDLRRRTDTTRKSVIAIYEEGQRIKEFVNVDDTFIPLSFC